MSGLDKLAGEVWVDTNQKGDYVFSCWIQVPAQSVKRRPWWSLFGRDKIVWENEWKPLVVDRLTYQQGRDYMPMVRAAIAISGGNGLAQDFQLKVCSTASNYQRTESQG